MYVIILRERKDLLAPDPNTKENSSFSDRYRKYSHSKSQVSIGCNFEILILEMHIHA